MFTLCLQCYARRRVLASERRVGRQVHTRPHTPRIHTHKAKTITETRTVAGVQVLKPRNKYERRVGLDALKGLARVSHLNKIALAGSRRLRSTLVAAPVLFAHDAVVTVTKSRSIHRTRVHVRS